MSRARRSRTYGLLAIVAAAGLIAITQAADRPAAKSKEVKPLATVPARRDDRQSRPRAVCRRTSSRRARSSSTLPTLGSGEVASYIADKCAINVLLDYKARFADAGITPATTLTFKISGVSLRSALNLMLAQKDLDVRGRLRKDNAQHRSRRPMQRKTRPCIACMSFAI